MPKKRINVRLDAADAAKAEALLAKGIKLSDIVRQAISAEYNRHPKKPPTGAQLAMVLEEMHAKYPVPDDVPPPPVDLTDRRAMQTFVREKIKRKLKRICSEAKGGAR